MTTLVGVATAHTTTVTPPAHLAGDLIIIAAFRSGSTTAPTLPTGYTSILTKSGTSSSMRVGYRWAVTTNDASGTWTNASMLACHVYRATGYTLGIGTSASSSSTTTTVNFPALTFADNYTGNSWAVGFVGATGVGMTVNVAPSGMTNQSSLASTNSIAGFDTNGGVTAWSSTNATETGSAANSVSCTVELIDLPENPQPSQVVQHIGGGSYPASAGATLVGGNSFYCPVSWAVGAGNCLLIGFTYPYGLTVTVTDNLNGAWTSGGSPAANPSGASSAIFYFANSAPGQCTVTVSFSGPGVNLFQYALTELYNIDASPAAGTTNAAYQTGPNISATAFTPTNNDGTGGNLIWVYSAEASTSPATICTGIRAGQNLTLLDADIGWNNADGLFHCSASYVQATHAAFTPTIAYVADTDRFNICAIALKINTSQGTPPAAGIRMARICHFTTDHFPTTTNSPNYNLQLPVVGNLRVVACTDPNIAAGTVITDSEGGTYSNAIAGAGIYYRANTQSNSNLQIVITGGGGDARLSWRVYDIIGASANPFDNAVALTDSTSSLTSYTQSTSPTPTVAPGMVIYNTGLGQGPGVGITAPSSAVWVLSTYQGSSVFTITGTNVNAGDAMTLGPTASLTGVTTGSTNILTASAVTGIILPGATLVGTGLSGVTIEPYGTSGTTGVGGSGTYALSSTPAALNEAMTTASTAYQWVSSIGSTPGNVLIGANAANSLSNLASSINNTAGSGTLYIPPTCAPSATAIASGTAIQVTTKTIGVTYNSTYTPASASEGSWTGTTFTGETDFDYIEDADLSAFYNYSTTAAIPTTWAITPVASNSTSGGFALFKAAPSTASQNQYDHSLPLTSKPSTPDLRTASIVGFSGQPIAPQPQWDYGGQQLPPLGRTLVPIDARTGYQSGQQGAVASGAIAAELPPLGRTLTPIDARTAYQSGKAGPPAQTQYDSSLAPLGRPASVDTRTGYQTGRFGAVAQTQNFTDLPLVRMKSSPDLLTSTVAGTAIAQLAQTPYYDTSLPPRGLSPSIDLRTSYQGGSFGAKAGQAFADLPPVLAQRSNDLLTNFIAGTTVISTAQVPFYDTSLPPRGLAASIDLKTAYQSGQHGAKSGGISSDLLPISALRTADLLTWVIGGTTIQPTAQTPYYDTSLPPRGPGPSVDLRTFYQSGRVGAKAGQSFADLPPVLARRSMDLLTWTILGTVVARPPAVLSPIIDAVRKPRKKGEPVETRWRDEAPPVRIPRSWEKDEESASEPITSPSRAVIAKTERDVPFTSGAPVETYIDALLGRTVPPTQIRIEKAPIAVSPFITPPVIKPIAIKTPAPHNDDDEAMELIALYTLLMKED